MENILLILIQRFSASLSSRTIFILYYSFIIVLIHLYHGLWLPSKYLNISREEYFQLWSESKTQRKPTEIRKNLIEPRRDFYSRRIQAEMSTEQNWKRFSYARRGQTVVQVEVEI